ncbi:unnamed protein product, partial [Staurois parvus]
MCNTLAIDCFGNALWDVHQRNSHQTSQRFRIQQMCNPQMF